MSVDRYAAVYGNFRWRIPERFNIGVAACDRWADEDPGRTAIIELDGDGIRRTTFAELRDHSNRLANYLIRCGFKRGDRIAVLAPQRLLTAVTHIAAYKAGAIAVPLFTLFGEDALLHRLRDSGTRFVVADPEGVRKIRGLRELLPALERVIPMDDLDLFSVIAAESNQFTPVDTAAEDPALIIYTSGTTGASKGALHAHRVLLGHVPGVAMSHNAMPQTGDCIWSPADWAWIGGLLDVLLPGLHMGIPVVAHRFKKFDPEAAFELMERCGVRNAFLPPTALKQMRGVADAHKRWKLSLRSVASGGESLGTELLEWGRKTFGVQINEFYGQTECNMIVSSCEEWFEPRPGSMGKAVPGHELAIIDENGEVVRDGQEGEIAVQRPDPVMFLEYWNRPEATTEKFVGDWLRTGDMGIKDADGFIRFVGRADDVITSAGYRIGPGEIEDCLLRHPAVLSAGVIGVPDAARTEIVTAFVVLRDNIEPSDALIAQLQDHVRTRLGGHQYPRRVIFTPSLPLTATGKIMRRELRALAQS